MKYRKECFSEDNRKRTDELTEKIFEVCVGEPMPIVIAALREVKQMAPMISKLMTKEEIDRLAGDNQETGSRIRVI